MVREPLRRAHQLDNRQLTLIATTLAATGAMLDAVAARRPRSYRVIRLGSRSGARGAKTRTLAASRTYLRRPSWARPISSRTSDVTPAISNRSTAEAGSVVSCVPASKAIMSRPLRIPTT